VRHKVLVTVAMSVLAGVPAVATAEAAAAAGPAPATVRAAGEVRPMIWGFVGRFGSRAACELNGETGINLGRWRAFYCTPNTDWGGWDLYADYI
jgi:hypothetical protein